MLRTAREKLSKAEALIWDKGGVRRSKKDKIRKWIEDSWARIFASFREHNLQRL